MTTLKLNAVRDELETKILHCQWPQNPTYCKRNSTHGVVTPDPFILAVARSRDQLIEHALLRSRRARQCSSTSPWVTSTLENQCHQRPPTKFTKLCALNASSTRWKQGNMNLKTFELLCFKYLTISFNSIQEFYFRSYLMPTGKRQGRESSKLHDVITCEYRTTDTK